MEKQQCSHCLEWFVNLERHKGKGCKAPCSGKDVMLVLPRDQLTMYDRMELSRRRIKKGSRRDEDINPGDEISTGFDMLDDEYEG